MKGAKDFPQMKIRISPQLKAKIEKLATKNNRTLNSEITTRLQASIDNGEITLDAIRSIIKEELSKK